LRVWVVVVELVVAGIVVGDEIAVKAIGNDESLMLALLIRSIDLILE